MLPASADRIRERLTDDDLVLDVGGWAKPFRRADWVLDLMPYETRGFYGDHVREGERFNADTWVERDMCAREPWPFADDQFDFSICSHTLEDVRDPLWVCSELSRVSKAGYVEVPSRLEEQAWGVAGPWVGWSHHHWLVDVAGSGIRFVVKPHLLHGRSDYHFEAPLAGTLTEHERVQSLFWSGELQADERIFFDEAEFDEYLGGFVRRHRAALAGRVPPSGGSPVRRLARRAQDLWQ